MALGLISINKSLGCHTIIRLIPKWGFKKVKENQSTKPR